ncbi:hypothetical protein M426DRAFT_158075 [Hypoxylon sp. CI-4A]|nr:hypothetical protein M426DRAFT_158075 [Hypoxylon sp. CI-4A]
MTVIREQKKAKYKAWFFFSGVAINPTRGVPMHYWDPTVRHPQLLASFSIALCEEPSKLCSEGVRWASVWQKASMVHEAARL